MEKDMISIVVPVYNVEDLLEKCLDSIKNQTYKNLEVVLVDDGSKDNSLEICNRYAQVDSRFKVIHQPNGGVAKARNTGVLNATGAYIGFVDSDDWIDEKMYETMYDCLKEFDSDVACCGRIDEPKGSSMYTLEKPQLFTTQQAIGSFLITKDFGGSLCERLYKRELLEGVDFVREYLPDDFITNYHLMTKANKIAHCGKAMYHYLWRANSVSHLVFNPRYLGYCYYSKEAYLDAVTRYPEVEKEAEYFFFHKTIFADYLCVSDDGDKEYRKVFKKEIRENIVKIIKNKYVEKGYKVFALAEVLGLTSLAITVGKALGLYNLKKR